MNFEYQASVIVPVYNVEQYLRICLDSLVDQTIDKSKMEVLVINDGSPDNSWDICLEYSEKYDFIKIFSKENEGLSATRNFGIKHAKGKYLFFLDSDDYFTPDTVKKVTDFFDTVYDEVDLVAYNEVRYKEDKILKPHFRFKMLDHEGVYDLYEYPYLTQTRVNVCVKNLGENNVLFNTTPGFK
ncbi:MAG: glycosyltransferase family 2 protein, partial [Clostridiaceae bacterium]|nr:glycosyltransferase family 2 protein [Clostridiaceae bacterium]